MKCASFENYWIFSEFLSKIEIFKPWMPFAFSGYAGQKLCVSLSESVYGIRPFLLIRTFLIRIFRSTAICWLKKLKIKMMELKMEPLSKSFINSFDLKKVPQNFREFLNKLIFLANQKIKMLPRTFYQTNLGFRLIPSN